MEIDNKILQELIKDVKTETDLNEILKALRKRGLEAALAGELTDHLGYDEHNRSQARKPNTGNGYHAKTLQPASGPLDINIPRDREGSFTPQIVRPDHSRIDGFDEKVIALDARGLSTRDIQSELSDLYGDDISPTLISNVMS